MFSMKRKIFLILILSAFLHHQAVLAGEFEDVNLINKALIEKGFYKGKGFSISRKKVKKNQVGYPGIKWSFLKTGKASIKKMDKKNKEIFFGERVEEKFNPGEKNLGVYGSSTPFVFTTKGNALSKGKKGNSGVFVSSVALPVHGNEGENILMHGKHVANVSNKTDLPQKYELTAKILGPDGTEESTRDVLTVDAGNSIFGGTDLFLSQYFPVQGKYEYCAFTEIHGELGGGGHTKSCSYVTVNVSF